MWQACSRCGLRLRYVTKGKATGQTRAVGPPPDQVEQAQEELKSLFAAPEMTEKIFNGKLMEIRGRTLVQSGGHSRTTVQVRADEKLGEAMMANASCSGSYPTASPLKPSKETKGRSLSPVPKTPAKKPMTPEEEIIAAEKMKNAMTRAKTEKIEKGKKATSSAALVPVAMSVNSEETVQEIWDSDPEKTEEEKGD